MKAIVTKTVRSRLVGRYLILMYGLALHAANRLVCAHDSEVSSERPSQRHFRLLNVPQNELNDSGGLWRVGKHFNLLLQTG